MAWASTKKVKKKVQTVYHPVAVVSVTLDPSDTVITLVTSAPKQKFAKGGRVSVSLPSSVLAGPTVFTISPRARGISPT